MHKNQPLLRRSQFAMNGLVHAMRAERSMRAHGLALAALLVVLLVTRPSPVWWAILPLAAGLAIAAELLNTAIEALADHLHPAQHRAIGIVKDCAAAGVLVSCLASLIAAVAFVVDLYQKAALR